MKVGVITFSNSRDNYGQILQCYAMQVFLRTLGHRPYLIRYNETIEDPTGFKLVNLHKYIFKLPVYIKWYIDRIRHEKIEKQYSSIAASHDRKFDEFIKKRIDSTELPYSPETITDNPPEADAYICGSDQIWGGSWPYYLSFAPDEAIKIAYAPSLGGLTSFTPEYESEMKRLLSRLDFIGMREQSGVDTCIKLGFPETKKVVDPTLLLDAGDYRSIAVDHQSSSPYLFCYLLGNPTSCRIGEVYDYANSHKLDVRYVANQRIDDFPKIYPTIEDWIGYIADADRVVTNSFHCVVFSLIFHKPVIYLPLNDGYERMNCRIDELLKSTGLEHLRYQGDLAKVDLSNIDFNRFDEWKLQEVFKSRSILSNLLKKS